MWQKGQNNHNNPQLSQQKTMRKFPVHVTQRATQSFHVRVRHTHQNTADCSHSHHRAQRNIVITQASVTAALVRSEISGCYSSQANTWEKDHQWELQTFKHEVWSQRDPTPPLLQICAWVKMLNGLCLYSWVYCLKSLTAPYMISHIFTCSLTTMGAVMHGAPYWAQRIFWHMVRERWGIEPTTLGRKEGKTPSTVPQCFWMHLQLHSQLLVVIKADTSTHTDS